jgi:hypothetical protein
MYMSLGAVVVGAVGALGVMALVNIVSGRKPWDLICVGRSPAQPGAV